MISRLSSRDKWGYPVRHDGALNAGLNIMPSAGLVLSAFRQRAWTANNEVTAWGGFDSVVSGKTTPILAAAGGMVGLKSRRGDGLKASGHAITGDFSYASKLYVPSQESLSSGYSVTWLNSNTWQGAVIGLDDSTNKLFLSKHGVSQVLCNAFSLTYAKTQTIIVTHSVAGSSTKFYVDGELAETLSDSQSYSHSDSIYLLPERTCGLIFFDMLAYTRVLSADECAKLHRVLMMRSEQ